LHAAGCTKQGIFRFGLATIRYSGILALFSAGFCLVACVLASAADTSVKSWVTFVNGTSQTDFGYGSGLCLFRTRAQQ
jgi:hypothetical protein